MSFGSSPFHTPIQQIQHLEKYSRWVDVEGRRETWDETVQRVIGFLHNNLRTQNRDCFHLSEWGVLATAMLNLDVMPSMRLVQMAGPSAERCNASAYNCFSGDTEFLTDSGIKTFSATLGQEVNVLSEDGVWRPARVHAFGVERLNKITFRPGKRSRTQLRHVVYATPSHGWVTTRGKVRDLQVGDEVVANSVDEPFDAREWVRGFGFGDGTTQDGCSRVRLCGQKSKFLPFFEATGCRVNYPPSSNGDPMISWEKGQFSDWKQLPDRPTPSWMQGYLAADGQHGQTALSTSNPVVLPFLIAHAAELGIVVTGVNYLTGPTNFGERTNPLAIIGVRPAEEVVWRVMAIEATDRVETVYCVSEPVTHTFTLAGGLLSMNCCFLPIDSYQSFAELLYLLMQGCGVGFSVEKHYNSLFSVVTPPLSVEPTVYVIPDTTDGWVMALLDGLHMWASGGDSTFDYSHIRPQGTRLKTKGGVASGPEPLRDLLTFARQVMQKAGQEHRRLSTLEMHDLACMCGYIVQVGGVRRAALISLSDLDDAAVRDCKAGSEWMTAAPWRAMANNSAVYEGFQSDTFEAEWAALMASGTGERGLFNRSGASLTLPARRDGDQRFGLNPCGEIILRPRQMCNLSIAVARPGDTPADLRRKVRLASIFGTIQSTLTKFAFPFAAPEWKQNCEEERLLGVDITGQFDCPLLHPSNPDRADLLRELRTVAVTTNWEFAQRLDINRSTAVTAIKPAGNSSQLLDVSSGIHPRYSQFYLRRLRIGAKTPMAAFLLSSGVPAQPEIGSVDMDDPSVWVFEFPVEAPKQAITRHDLTVLDQLNNWLMWKHQYTEHSVSCTVFVGADEWDATKAWVREHWEDITGLSFLPKEDANHHFALAPYEELTEAEFHERQKAMPVLDFAQLRDYETEDTSAPALDFACVSGVCAL